MKKSLKSTPPRSRPIGGIRTSLTSEETILPNAAPMITPTARSTTLPRMANSLNSFSTVFLLCFFDEGEWRPCANSPVLRGPSLRGLYPTREEKQRNRYGGQKHERPTAEKIFQLGRRRRVIATIPRSTRTAPPATSIGPTQAKGTRVIASIRIPRSTRESPRVQFSHRAHHWPGL